MPPDVVLVHGNARQLMLLAEAAQAAGVAGGGAAMGRPTCAVLPEAINSARRIIYTGATRRSRRTCSGRTRARSSGTTARSRPRMTHRAMGAEARGLSAVDIALWDLFGQSVGLPIYACLGGPVRDRIRIYNTCAGYGYSVCKRPAWPAAPSRPAGAWARRRGRTRTWSSGRTRTGPASWRASCCDDGITAMKIWPFDQFADETGGQHITRAQIEQGLKPFRQIREAVGMQMEIAVELHSRWNLHGRARIAEALEEIAPDVVRGPDPDGQRRRAGRVRAQARACRSRPRRR